MITATIVVIASVSILFAYNWGRRDGFWKDGLPVIEAYRTQNKKLWERLYAKGEL